MRLEDAGGSILEPLISRYGMARVQEGCLSALGFPPELVTEVNEVRKIVTEIGGEVR